MQIKVVCITLLLNITFSIEKNIQNNFDIFFDYDFNAEKDTLRQRFLDKKKQNQAQEAKIQLFDRMNSNKTLFVDGILHLLDDNLKNEMENSFRNVLTMNGSKYIFKRDFFWRTWREVKNESGFSMIICYKCQGFVNKTCSKCRSGGYWVIEEKAPSCPYEIFSLNTEQEVCIVNFAQYSKSLNSCPSIITMRDLKMSCGNSIETKLRIMKIYTVPERNTAVICQGRENCEISTLYSILPDSIIFRLINSTNHVFFSKVMKNDNKNYICLNDCGIFNPVTKEITKNDGPFVFDLLKNIKNKRENKFSPQRFNTKANIINMITNKEELIKNGLHYKERKRKESRKTLKLKDTSHISKINNINTKAHCKKLQEKYLEEEDESDYDYL